LNIIYENLAKLKKKIEKIFKNIAKTQAFEKLKKTPKNPITLKPNLPSPDWVRLSW
jgi:hypothetical protein